MIWVLIRHERRSQSSHDSGTYRHCQLLSIPTHYYRFCHYLFESQPNFSGRVVATGISGAMLPMKSIYGLAGNWCSCLHSTTMTS